MSDYYISIRSIQHYLYCPHRWGLIEINKCWAENAFVTKANLIHERVHDPDNNYSYKGKKVFTSVEVYNDNPDYMINGITDCIEAVEASDGIALENEDKRYNLTIVEYKPTKPINTDFNTEDVMQVFAQKLCVDFIFGCDSKAVIYYSDVKKRFPLPFKEKYSEYDLTLKKILADMRYNIENGIIPSINKNQKCNGCSMKDLCMPKVKVCHGIRKKILELSEDRI